jgi:hypothetical protein
MTFLLSSFSLFNAAHGIREEEKGYMLLGMEMRKDGSFGELLKVVDDLGKKLSQTTNLKP